MITEYKEPWQHWIIDDVFPDELFRAVQQHEINDADYTNVNGFRDIIKGRTFLGDEYCEKHPKLKPVAEFLNSDPGATLIDHTSKDLGHMLLDCASNSKNKRLDQDVARRKERHELKDFVENSKCVNRHFELLGLKK